MHLSLSFTFTLVVLAAVCSGNEDDCPCQLSERPSTGMKAATARWMMHSLDWGTLNTISSRFGKGEIPFGNIYSFVDGTCSNSTGTPYFYGTFLDQSLVDSTQNPTVSLTLSEASLSSVCGNKKGLEACSLRSQYGDPENPVCARLTVTGELVVLKHDSAEYEFATSSLFERHSSMATWPKDHNWLAFKIDIKDIWLIDYFGGASIIPAKEYFSVDQVVADDQMRHER